MSARAKSYPTMATAAVWGFAEAVFFFIVPDVLLSRLALRNWRRALLACVCATLGALIGGLLVYAAGHNQPDATRAGLDFVPAVSAEMIARTGANLERDGWRALFGGMFTGTPYKIFAAQAGRLDLHLMPFLGASAAARAFRFVAVSLLAFGLAHAMRRICLSETAILRCHAGGWILFYALFFLLMPN